LCIIQAEHSDFVGYLITRLLDADYESVGRDSNHAAQVLFAVIYSAPLWNDTMKAYQ